LAVPVDGEWCKTAAIASALICVSFLYSFVVAGFILAAAPWFLCAGGRFTFTACR